MNDNLSRSGVIAIISIVVYGLISMERIVHAIDPNFASTPIPYLSLGATFATLAMTYFGLKTKKKYIALTVCGIINVLMLIAGGCAMTSSVFSPYYKVIDWGVAVMSLIVAIIYVFICIDES